MPCSVGTHPAGCICADTTLPSACWPSFRAAPHSTHCAARRPSAPCSGWPRRDVWQRARLPPERSSSARSRARWRLWLRICWTQWVLPRPLKTQQRQQRTPVTAPAAARAAARAVTFLWSTKQMALPRSRPPPPAVLLAARRSHAAAGSRARQARALLQAAVAAAAVARGARARLRRSPHLRSFCRWSGCGTRQMMWRSTT